MYLSVAASLVDGISYGVVVELIEVLSLSRDGLELVEIALKTGHSTHVMLAEAVGIVEQILVCKGRLAVEFARVVAAVCG